MPARDGTGPKGNGPMTGRGAGYCVIPLNTTEEKIKFLQNQERASRNELRHVGSEVKRVQERDAGRELAR